MRNLFYLILLLTIFNASTHAQGGSTCTTVTIYCPDEQNFLDTVEAKLLHTIDRIKKGENKISVGSYAINPNDGTDWSDRMTTTEIKHYTYPEKSLPTYQYELVINWNSHHDTGYVLGFSKEYCYEKYVLEYLRYKGAQIPGIYIEPFYHIPLSAYTAFLTQKEVDKLYRIIEKNFINYINVDTSVYSYPALPIDTSFLCQMFSDTSFISHQTLDLNKNDALVLMPLSFWAKLFRRWLDTGELLCYNDIWCRNKPLNLVEARDIFRRVDTAYDENRNKVALPYECFTSSIAVANRWVFDTLNRHYSIYYPPPYALRITRKIFSIAVITHCGNTPDKTGWLSYKDLVEISNKNNLYYYREQLDNALFKKLNLKYPRLY